MTDSNLELSVLPSAVVTDTTPGPNAVVTRRTLVPMWIKAFSWLFIVLGASVPLSAGYALATGAAGTFEIFGLQHRGSPFDPMTLLVYAIMLYLAVSAHGLLSCKPWAIRACLVAGYGGLAICVATMVYNIAQGSWSLRLEPVFQVLFIRRLHAIEPQWAGAPEK